MTCFQNMFYSKKAPKQKGGCLDTPWIRHWLEFEQRRGKPSIAVAGPRGSNSETHRWASRKIR